MNSRNILFSIVGYSGHSFVVLDSAFKSKLDCKGYYDRNKKEMNPFDIDYLGSENNIVTEERIYITIRKQQYSKRYL